MRFKNLYLALKGQLPLKRAFINFFVTRNAWGMFSKNSHIVAATGQPKIMYNRLTSAEKAAISMSNKYSKKFRPYKCIWCDGYHVGKTKV